MSGILYAKDTINNKFANARKPVFRNPTHTTVLILNMFPIFHFFKITIIIIIGILYSSVKISVWVRALADRIIAAPYKAYLTGCT